MKKAADRSADQHGFSKMECKNTAIRPIFMNLWTNTLFLRFQWRRFLCNCSSIKTVTKAVYDGVWYAKFVYVVANVSCNYAACMSPW